MTGEHVEFHDQESSSAAFMVVRTSPGSLSLGFGVEDNGDLDLMVSVADARRLAQALLRATSDKTTLYCPCLLTEDEESIFYEAGAFSSEAPAQRVLERWREEGRTEPMSINIIPLYETFEAWDADR